MKKYAKIVNNETKECQVGTGTNVKFYQSIGMVEMDVGQAANGQWYVKGYEPDIPLPTIEELQADIRKKRDIMLTATDKYMLSDFPITNADRELMKMYRAYLRDYTKQDNWWESLPDGFADWRANIEKVDEIQKESTKPEAEEAEPEK